MVSDFTVGVQNHRKLLIINYHKQTKFYLKFSEGAEFRKILVIQALFT